MNGVCQPTARTSPTASPADAFVLTLWTDDRQLALAADRAGVDRIGVDLERLGKAERQRHRPTWISPHTVADLRAITATLDRALVFARVNPLHEGTAAEVSAVLEAGARTLMLPMVATRREAERFVAIVDGRASVTLLVERMEAVEAIEQLVAVPGVAEVHVGLNDLSLSMGLPNRWLTLAGDVVMRVAAPVLAAGLRFGLGGIGRPDDNQLPIPSDLVYAEYARTGATAALIARSFHVSDEPHVFGEQVARARGRLAFWRSASADMLLAAHQELGRRAAQLGAW